MDGRHRINLLEPRRWDDGSEPDDPDAPPAFHGTLLAQHISFLRDIFRVYKDFDVPHIDTLELMIERLYRKWGINDKTDFSRMLPTDYPTAIDHSFKDYRKRVLDRFGEQVEKELRYNIKAQEIEETVVDAKGKEKTVKKTADVVDEGWDPNKYSPYAKIFDELHPDWMKDAERNMFYLKARQSQANDMLKARGHLFLNEVYDLLGFERTKAGAVVGWVYDPDEPIGDNFVDFGIFEIQRPKARDFVNGYEPAIVLDFNVVGDITNLIATHQYL